MVDEMASGSGGASGICILIENGWGEESQRTVR